VQADQLQIIALGLFDSDLGAALAGVRQVLDAAVNDGTNPLQELDPGIREVFPHLGRHIEGFPGTASQFRGTGSALE
jgi:hypothetical protein